MIFSENCIFVSHADLSPFNLDPYTHADCVSIWYLLCHHTTSTYHPLLQFPSVHLKPSLAASVSESFPQPPPLLHTIQL
jgi:hypothetical protein